MNGPFFRETTVYTSQLSVTQNTTVITNGENNASKAKKHTHGSHLISVN